jgi:hypothetical protein
VKEIKGMKKEKRIKVSREGRERRWNKKNLTKRKFTSQEEKRTRERIITKE